MAFIETEILIFTKKSLLEKYSYENFSLLKKENATFKNPYFSGYLETQNYYLIASNKFRTHEEYLNSDERWEKLWETVIIDIIFPDEINYPQESEDEIPDYLKSKTDDESFGVLKVEDKYRGDLELMLRNMIEMSEVQSIIFASQYQDNNKEIILGTIQIEVFLEKLFKNEILANVFYVLSD